MHDKDHYIYKGSVTTNSWVTALGIGEGEGGEGRGGGKGRGKGRGRGRRWLTTPFRGKGLIESTIRMAHPFANKPQGDHCSSEVTNQGLF